MPDPAECGKASDTISSAPDGRSRGDAQEQAWSKSGSHITGVLLTGTNYSSDDCSDISIHDVSLVRRGEIQVGEGGRLPISSPYAGFHDLEDTHMRGQASEAILKAAFLARGIPVLISEYDNEPYDFVAEHAGQFLRIQAKTAYQTHEGTIRFETVTTRRRSDGCERSGYDGMIDCFAVFNPELGEVCLISEGEASSGKMEIRCEPTENNQQVGVDWHEDYLIDEVLSSLVSEPSSP